MNTIQNKTLTLEDGKPTGRRYDSIELLMQGEGVPLAMRQRVKELVRQRLLQSAANVTLK